MQCRFCTFEAAGYSQPIQLAQLALHTRESHRSVTVAPDELRDARAVLRVHGLLPRQPRPQPKPFVAARSFAGAPAAGGPNLSTHDAAVLHKTRHQWRLCRQNLCRCTCRCHTRTCTEVQPSPGHFRRGFDAY